MKKINIFYSLLFCMSQISGYGLPSLNLGNTNFLDGGPIRPSPGFYFFQYFDSYYSNKFTDNNGNKLKGLNKPHFNYFAGATQLVYQTKDDFFLRAAGGVSFIVPYCISTHINKNDLGIIDRGKGLGNIQIGGYLQWKPININNRPLFVHRLEVDFMIPQNTKELKNIIYPAATFFYIDIYWAATLYLTEKLALSWRINYLNTFKDKINDQKIGNAIYTNYSLAYQTTEKLWLGINGYYLEQLQNNKFLGKVTPETKERTLGIGPGGVYFFSQDFVLFGHLYFESLTRNRPQGAKLAANIVIHF
ncbi:MAG: transporter [Candidatus Babeliales bacterium]|nr:transporter [Candidatus Babeliales bacterium]